MEFSCGKKDFLKDILNSTSSSELLQEKSTMLVELTSKQN